jgi:hypothetical protein
MHVPYSSISGGRILIEGHRKSFTLKNAVDETAVAAVLSDLLTVLEGVPLTAVHHKRTSLQAGFFVP